VGLAESNDSPHRRVYDYITCRLRLTSAIRISSGHQHSHSSKGLTFSQSFSIEINYLLIMTVQHKKHYINERDRIRRTIQHVLHSNGIIDG